MPAKTDSKPADDWVAIVQRGIKAQGLVTAHAADLGARIPAGFGPALAADLASLGAVVPAAITAHDGSVQQTAAQNTALASLYALVTAARTAVRGQQPSKDILLAYGVGSKTSHLLVKSVKSAAQKIIDRATAKPVEANSFGIIDVDITAIQAAMTALDAADKAQEAARAGAPLTTKQRNTIARRIIASTKLVAGAGMMAYANNPTVRATFEALLKKTP